MNSEEQQFNTLPEIEENIGKELKSLIVQINNLVDKAAVYDMYMAFVPSDCTTQKDRVQKIKLEARILKYLGSTEDD